MKKNLQGVKAGRRICTGHNWKKGWIILRVMIDLEGPLWKFRTFALGGAQIAARAMLYTDIIFPMRRPLVIYDFATAPFLISLEN